ncbi:MAG: SCP2 domain-containing protein [Oxalobacteraceae bacterium]
MIPVSPLIAVLNHLLVSQPQLVTALAAHAGKSAHIDAGIRLRLRVAADGLLETVAADEATADPNVTISIAPADLPLVLADPERAASFAKLSGDAEFARTVSEVVTGLHWDAESDLAPIVGDIAAVRIVQAARAMAAYIKSGARHLIENVAEYLLEENPTLLYRRAGEDFASDVAVLRDDVERLSKRIALLEKLGGAA